MDSTSRHISKSKSMALLKHLIDEIPHLRTLNYKNPELRPWLERVKNILSLAFGDEDYQKFVNAEWRSDMRLMGDEVHQGNYQHNLTTLKTILQSIIDKHELLATKTQPTSKRKPKDADELLLYLYDAINLHPKIINASRQLFKNGHYAQAIFEACKAVENFVQDKSGLTLYGTNLMEKVFNEENPIIKVPEAGHYDREVQKGFKHLFIGASQGIRNPKAHKEIIQKDPYITFQYLGFFSFLLKRIDYWNTDIS
jgi:uncharacterized protein (TIGR02391 family)